MGSPQQTGEFKLGDFVAEKGGTIHDGKLVWQSHGTLNGARDNLILYPSSYSAQHQDMSWLIGEDKILDPRVGASSSPICSRTGFPRARPRRRATPRS